MQGEDISKIRKSIQVSESLRQSRRQSVDGSPISLQQVSQGPDQSHTGNGKQLKTTGAVAVAALTMPGLGTHSRLIYDDQNQWNVDVVDVRNEGDPAVAQQNANNAYDALGATLEF
jgi:hypothetical protein